MKKTATYIILTFLVLVTTGLYFFYKEPADVRNLDIDMDLTAADLVSMYENEEEGNAKLLGKVVAVTGVVKGVERNGDNWSVYLASNDPLIGITCSFYPDEEKSIEAIEVGSEIKVKGVCTGKIIDVVLNHCSIMK